MSRRPTIEQVFETATEEEAKKWGRFDYARFHMFNPNGVANQWKDLGDRIIQAADEGKCKTGAWVAYGPFGHFHDQLMKLSTAKQFKASEITVIVKLIKDTIAKGEAFLKEIGA